jgi:hypothetical protein
VSDLEQHESLCQNNDEERRGKGGAYPGIHEDYHRSSSDIPKPSEELAEILQIMLPDTHVQEKSDAACISLEYGDAVAFKGSRSSLIASMMILWKRSSSNDSRMAMMTRP